MKTKFFALLFLLVLTLLPISGAYAASGIGLSPAIQEINISEDQQSASFNIHLTNSTTEAVSLRLSTLDFGSLNESGGIAFIGRTGQETTSYGLRQWMLLEKDSITLEPNQSQEVRVTIDNKQSLGAGGHYGAVIVSAASENQDTGDNLSVVPAASTLVLLKKTGGEFLELKLDSAKTNSSPVSLPNGTELRFQNSGNTHLVPRGTVELYGPTGSLVSRGTINPESGFILPDSFRRFSVQLSQQDQPWMPGRYKQVVSWRYDGSNNVVETVTHHWYIGKFALLVIIILSLVLVLILFRKRQKRAPIRGL